MKEKEQGLVGSDQNNKVEHVSLHTVSNTKKMCWSNRVDIIFSLNATRSCHDIA
jgi:hypothetical protein